jgi:V/A-type H+-transporting ATPase subunit E
MKGLETGKDKIQKICDVIRKETIDPAHQEAREIVENAHIQAAEIERNARGQAAEKMRLIDAEIEEKKRLFESSLQLAARQSVEELKNRIEQELFQKEVTRLVAKEMGEPQFVSDLVLELARHLNEESYKLQIPKELLHRLSAEALKALKGRPLEPGEFAGGVKVRLEGKHLMIDLTDEAIRDLLSRYLRPAFRELLFG